MGKFLAIFTTGASLVLANSAGANERWEWFSGTSMAYVEMGPTHDPACEAQVVFYDNYAHTGVNEFTLAYGKISVGFEIKFSAGYGPEALIITAPEGYYALPATLTPGETNHGVAHICPIGLVS